MNPLNKSGHLSHLSLMCINHSKLMTRMALICFQTNKYPAPVEMTLVFLKYIQLISQVVLFNFYLHGNAESYASDWYSKGVIFIAKLFNPAFWMPYENKDLLVFCVLIGIMCFMALRYSLFAYVVWVAYKDRDGDPRIIRIWGYVFKIQGRVFYSLLSTFFVNTILTFSSSGLKTPGIGRVGLIIWCVLMIVVEYSFSLFLQIRFCYTLPARGLLACKDNRTEMILLAQKLAIHLLAIILKKNSTTSLWVFSSINLLFCIGRDWEYFTGLPFYNLWTLKYQGVLLEILTSLNVTCFLQSIAKSSNFGEIDMAFILVVWVITGALFIKLAVQYLENIKIQVIMQPGHASPDLLTHKVSVIRHLRSVMQMPAAANKKYQWSYLLNRSINANIQKVLDIGADFAPDVELDINSKASINRMILNYLEHLSTKYPKNNFLRLYIAYFYAKKLKLYGNAVKIITELQQHSHSNAVVNASLLIYEIQNVLKAEYQNDDTQLDFFTFSISQAYNARLKIKMLEQADTQINICTEVIKDIPDLSKIFNWSQKLEVSRKNIERKMERILKVTPEYYIQPILTASEYNLKLNHSCTAYTKYKKMYTSRYQKYEKAFRSIKLNKENLYQDNSVFLQLAGNKTDAGKIIFCTKAVQNVFGGDNDNYIGSQIFSLLPSSLQPYYANLFQKLLQGGDRKTVNKQARNFFYHKDGSIIEGDFYVNIHPFLTRGFCLNMVIRPVPFYNDYLLVKENGDIEGASKKIGQKLGLLAGRHAPNSHAINLRQLNGDLAEINDIFNIMSYPGMTFEDKVKEREKRSKSLKSQANSHETFEIKKKNSKKTTNGSLYGNMRLSHTSAKDDYEFYDKALTLYNIYSAGKDVNLTSLKRRDEDDERSSNSNYRIYSYHCKIENLTFGNTKMKIFIMEENRNRHDLVNDGAGALTAKTDAVEISKLSPNISVDGDLQQSVKNSKEPSDNGFYDLRSEDDANDLEAADFQSLMLFKSIRPEDPLALTSPDPELAKTIASPYSPEDLQTSPSPMNKLETILTTVNNETYPTQEAYSLPLLNPVQVSVKQQQTRHFEKKMSGKPAHIDQSNSTQSENEDPNAPNKVEKVIKKFMTENSIAASAKSRSVRTKKLSDAYLSALNSKYYPKFFNLACLLLYIALIATFSTQIQLKSTLDKNLTELTVKKEVLSNAQNRNFMLVLLEALFRMIWNLYGGRLTASDLGLVGLFIPSFMSTGVGVLEALAKVNQALVVNTNSMDADRRDMMFLADVRVYDNYFDSSDQSYVKLTSFQATESLVQSSLKVVASQSDLSKVEDELKFIFRNSLNDLLIKNEDISSLFLKALNEQKDNIENIVDIFMISDIVALAFVGGLFSVIIWKQYQREKTNMFAVTKLNTAKVEQVIENLYHFKRSLENERKMDDEEAVESRRTSKVMGASKAKGKENQKKEHMKVPKCSGLRWRYYRFTGELFIFIVVIIGLVLINSFVDRDSVNFFQDKENQLYFTDRMKSRFFIDTVTSQELLAVDNDIAMIENTLCSEYINYAIQDIANLRVQAAAIYKDSDGVTNSQIREILYTDGCNLSGSFYTQICAYLESQGVQTGLIYLLDKMEVLISNIQERYELSDKSTTSLVAIQTTDYSLFTFIELLLAGQCQEISDILNADFDDETSAAKSRRNAVLIVFSILMVILCILIWIYVLKKIKEADNQFKIVLKSFPAGLVLSSFILKRFLIETSTGALDFVKNDI